MLNKPEGRGHPARQKRRIPKAFAVLMLVAGSLVGVLANPASATIPTVSSASPNSGPLTGGTNIIVKGTGFTGTTGVKIGTVTATDFSLISDTQLAVTVPAAAAAGSLLIEVTNGTGPNTTGGTFKYVGPTIKSVSPGWGLVNTGAVVAITGTGFTGAVAADVEFGGVAASQIFVISDTQIIAEAPTTGSSNGEVDIVVTRNSVASPTSEKTKFLFSPGLPTVTLLGESGTEVQGTLGTNGVATGGTMKITGTQLWAVKQVNFGSSKVASTDITLTSDTEISVVVPTRSNGPVDVTVTNAAGTSVTGLKTTFSYYSTTAPKITSLSSSVFDKATSGGGGTFLVAGSGFTGVGSSQVTITCAAQSPTVSAATAVSDSSLIVTTGGTADGSAQADCDLKIDNPIDSNLTVTKADAIRFV